MSSIKNFFYIAARIEICYTFSKIISQINNNCVMIILLLKKFIKEKIKEK